MIGKKNKKNNKNNKNLIAPCPCGPSKETFQNIEETSDDYSLADTTTKIDDYLKAFFGNSKLVIGTRKYKLKRYRWFIVTFLLFFIILIVLSIKGDSKTSVVPEVVKTTVAPTV